jgi:hypothetical protein
MMRNWVPVNMNDRVRIRLTDDGRRILADRRIHRVLAHQPTEEVVQEDENGWSYWQVWVLMQTFGQKLHHSSDQMPFEMGIEFDVVQCQSVLPRCPHHHGLSALPAHKPWGAPCPHPGCDYPAACTPQTCPYIPDGVKGNYPMNVDAIRKIADKIMDIADQLDRECFQARVVADLRATAAKMYRECSLASAS